MPWSVVPIMVRSIYYIFLLTVFYLQCLTKVDKDRLKKKKIDFVETNIIHFK